MHSKAGAAAVLAAAIAAGGGVGSTASASPPGAGSALEARPVTSTVTLITGDRVAVTERADGKKGVSVERGAGREGVGFVRYTENDRLYVLPTDVADLVPDHLDLSLFDVTTQIAAGYHERESVPVIVRQTAPGQQRATLSEDVLDSGWADLGITPDRTLDSIGAVAADLDPASTGDLLEALDALGDDGGATARAATSDPAVKVWLDAPVRVSDADSMPQIGAPAAWDAGYDGEGVTVAVLDTGVDTTHPDLDDAVVAARDFSGTGSTTDRFGHGTHVASIAVGSGDASDGVNRGVAPGADLLVGKVLDDDGYGEMSWVIDGMEWAAAQDADVVNLSLGDPDVYPDGTDPGSMALDALSEETGTLFVVSAGNSGPERTTVGSPGTASRALTVGAVDDADLVTDYSSRGPRAGDVAIKPDVTAPGDGIVAALAAGTEPGEVVDEWHVALSGTSMAAPHVAGAAAVLKQARPELTGEDLKAVLMGSAQHTSGTVWDEGAGRIHLPAALDQAVTASPASLSLGNFTYPGDGTETRTLTYTNRSGTDLTLDLAIDATGPDGEQLGEGAVALSAPTVSVPAHGTATVDVIVDRAAGGAGMYSGDVTATAPEGAQVRTALGWSKLVHLNIQGLGKDGEPFDGHSAVGVMNVDTGRTFSGLFSLEDGELNVLVPPGSYSVTGKLWREDAEGAVTEMTAVLEPEIDAGVDRAVVLDVRKAEPVSVETERPAERESVSLSMDRTDDVFEWLVGLTAEVPGAVDLSATPTDPVATGDLDVTAAFALAAPTAGDEAPAYTYDLMYHQHAVETFAFEATSGNTTAVDVGYAEVGPEAEMSSRRSGEIGDRWWVFWLGPERPVKPGAVRTEYVSAGDVSWSHQARATTPAGERVTLSGDQRTYPPGEHVVSVMGGAVLNTRFGTNTQINGANDGMELAFEPWTDGAGHEAWSWSAAAETGLVVSRDGDVLLDTEDITWRTLAVPEGEADYRITLDAARSAARFDRSTRLRTEWTFRGDPTADGGAGPLPLLDIAYDVARVDLANTAPRRTVVTLGVGHRPGSGSEEITKTRLWWSADDGETWRPARLWRTGGAEYSAHVTAPRGTEHVALRVMAEDAAGSRIDQTVIRAYGVR